MPLACALAAVDMLVWVVPTDVILASTAALQPKRWATISLWFTTGSAIGALLMGIIIQATNGALSGYFTESYSGAAFWLISADFIQQWGFSALAVSAFGPFPIQPPVILASLAEMSPLAIFSAIWLGRSLKYAAFAWLSARSPRLISRILGGIPGETSLKGTIVSR